MSDSEKQISIPLTQAHSGMRLDKALADILTDHTRSSIQQWIKKGMVKVDGAIVQQKYHLKGTEILEIDIPEPVANDWIAQPMELQIVFEDEHILVINKPAGLVVHPGAGISEGTLLNGLIYYHPSMAELPRAGIVHRLDKDTTGLMVVAKTDIARQKLIKQLETREMHRQYIAVVNGVMISGETIEQPIGRNPHNRLLMSVIRTGKSATTYIRVLEKFRSHCLVQATLGTGRTHQIRVHLSWKGYPIVGDPQYGKYSRIPDSASENLVNTVQNFHRQALHAKKLSLNHPVSEETLTWSSDPPNDLLTLLAALREDSA